jgi:hypothetical protein
VIGKAASEERHVGVFIERGVRVTAGTRIDVIG